MAASERHALGGEPTALVISEAESATAELFLQNTVLLDELVDLRRLLAMDPAGDDSEQESKGLDSQHDAEIVPVDRNVAGCWCERCSSFRTGRAPALRLHAVIATDIDDERARRAGIIAACEGPNFPDWLSRSACWVDIATV